MATAIARAALYCTDSILLGNDVFDGPSSITSQ